MRFFLLGTKARILGLTFGGSSGIGKASDPIPTPAGGKSGRHWNLCYLLSVCTLFRYPYGLSRNSWSGLTGPRASEFQPWRTLQGWLRWLETSRPSSCRGRNTFSLCSRLNYYFWFGADSVPRGFWSAFRVSVSWVSWCISVSPFLPAWDKD